MLLDGIAKAQFDATAQAAFKKVVAAGIGNQCAPSADNWRGTCTADDVTILRVLDARRAGAQVTFDVNVAAERAAAAIEDLSTFLSTEVTQRLQAQGGNLAAVQSTSVVAAPTAMNIGGGGSAADGEDDSNEMMYAVAGSVGSCLVLIALGVIYQQCCTRSDHHLKGDWKDFNDEIDVEMDYPTPEIAHKAGTAQPPPYPTSFAEFKGECDSLEIAEPRSSDDTNEVVEAKDDSPEAHAKSLAEKWG